LGRNGGWPGAQLSRGLATACKSVLRDAGLSMIIAKKQSKTEVDRSG
jgi:hypothetical protein